MYKAIILFYLFFGMNFAMAQINLPSMRGVINSKSIISTMFSGGKGFGSNQKQLIQNMCSPLQVESIYFGGEGYGNQANMLSQLICTAVPVESIFYGGGGYGSQIGMNIQSICAPITVESIYSGGQGIGSQEVVVTQSACQPLLVESIYYVLTTASKEPWTPCPYKYVRDDCDSNKP